MSPDKMICGKEGAGNNFAKGYYTEGSEVIMEVMDAVRKEAERADCLHGFQISHSIGGGTGSGLGSLIISRLKEEYPYNLVMTFSVFPASEVSDCVVEPYNAGFALSNLVENSDATVILDNLALLDICKRRLKVKMPKYKDLNGLVASAMSDSTCSFRFRGDLNSDIRKMCINLVPFPRLHFFLASLAPLGSRKAKKSTKLTTGDITAQMMDFNNLLCSGS